MSIHTLVLHSLIPFLLKVRHQKWRCGYLDIPLATNVASESILLDTAAINSSNIAQSRAKMSFDETLTISLQCDLFGEIVANLTLKVSYYLNDP